jgi:hypothetical protein
MAWYSGSPFLAKNTVATGAFILLGTWTTLVVVLLVSSVLLGVSGYFFLLTPSLASGLFLPYTSSFFF